VGRSAAVIAPTWSKGRGWVYAPRAFGPFGTPSFLVRV